MAKYINTGDTIEAEHTDACSRKIEWKGLRKHPITNENMTLYECDRNSTAEIIKIHEGVIKDGTEHFHRENGDILEADAIRIYIASPRKERVYLKEGVSGRHGAQFIDIRKRSISTIKYPFEIFRKYLKLNGLLDTVNTINAQ
ncbi:MAG: hypothetical protein LBO74_05110 [Candidatus Symbiothrix sp.]|jgi:hypothetical protein|nr:hypothetical protein [Candidatus Symbiothrix sp.]